MANLLRRSIAERLQHAFTKTLGPVDDVTLKAAWCLRQRPVNKKQDPSQSQWEAPFSILNGCGILPAKRFEEQLKVAKVIADEMQCDELLQGVDVGKKGLLLTVGLDGIRQTLVDVLKQGNTYGTQSVIHDFIAKNESLQPTSKNETVVVEFSSPNIAKPFHAGHLRSTVIGNFVANLNAVLGHHVVRLNYLGDWGTQFGILGAGYQLFGEEHKLKQDAMKHLFDVYVRANKILVIDGKESETFRQDSQEFFQRMEAGDEEALDVWRRFRSASLQDYQETYSRLGVCFDEYHMESMYNVKSQEVVQLFREKGLLKKHPNSNVQYVDLASEDNPKYYANVLKSDGTTLYLTRDIAALIDRVVKYKLNRIHYVVENGQHMHFQQLRGVVNKLDVPWSSVVEQDNFHVKFGRVEGMSTRKGEVVFLQDILDQARDCMLDNMKQTSTTKVTSNLEEVADHLGISAVIIQDLKEHRQKNYKFDWDNLLNFNGDTGLFLQYTHARLCSLEQNCGFALNIDTNLDTLVEPSATRIVLHLARYDEVLQHTFQTLEASYLAAYLFQLARLINVAHQELQVKGRLPDHTLLGSILTHLSLGNVAVISKV